MSEAKEDKEFIDIHETTSDRSGLLGFIERQLRRHKTLTYMVFYFVIVLICLTCLSLSLVPLVYLLSVSYELTLEMGLFLRSIVMSFSFALGLLVFIPMMLITTAFFNWLNPFEIKPFKGNWYSVEGIPWFYHNALFYLVRYSILDFITPSPIALWYLRAMGMKMGKGVLINTSNISDPCLIELGDYVTLGGSVTIIAHYGQKGILILAPTVIKSNVMVGLKASIFWRSHY